MKPGEVEAIEADSILSDPEQAYTLAEIKSKGILHACNYAREGYVAAVR